MKNIIYLVVGLLITITAAQKVSAQEYLPVIEAKIAPLKMILGGVSIGADFCLNDNVSVESNFQYKDRAVFERKVVSLQGFGKYYFNSKKGADRFYGGGYLKIQKREFEFIETSKENRIALGAITGYKIVSDAGVVIDFTLGFGRNLYNKISGDPGNSQASIVGGNETPSFDYISRLSVGYRFGTNNESSKEGKLQRKLKESK